MGSSKLQVTKIWSVVAGNWSFPVMHILLMEEILHQLIGSLSQYLHGLYIPGGGGFLPSTVFPL